MSKHHSHSHIPEFIDFQRSFAIAVIMNFLFCIAQVSYAFVAHSMSLLADAGHNFGDVIGLVMAWGANWLYTRHTSEKYSYGYKKTTILAALANALILFGGVVIIAYESIIRLFHPVILNEPIIIIVAFIGMLVNGSSALLFLKGKESDLNIKSAFLHLSKDALLSLGVVFTGIIILWTKAAWLDPAVSLILILFILITTWDLLRDSVSAILDAVPHSIDIDSVKADLKAFSGAEAIHDLHIWELSTRDIALTAHLVIPRTQLFSDQHHESINTHLKQKFNISHVTLQVEHGELHDPCGQTHHC